MEGTWFDSFAMNKFYWKNPDNFVSSYKVRNFITYLTLAYIVELEEDVAESSNVNDIPTTIIRSKQDIAAGAASAASLSNSTNDIVINKLTQILSYLRAGKNFYIFYKEIEFSTSYI